MKQSLCQEKYACHKNVVALKWEGITADTEKETRNSDGKRSTTWCGMLGQQVKCAVFMDGICFPFRSWCFEQYRCGNRSAVLADVTAVFINILSFVSLAQVCNSLTFGSKTLKLSSPPKKNTECSSLIFFLCPLFIYLLLLLDFTP